MTQHDVNVLNLWITVSSKTYIRNGSYHRSYDFEIGTENICSDLSVAVLKKILHVKFRLNKTYDTICISNV